MTYIKGGIVAGIILFLWGTFSWMVLPWHHTTLNAFKDEQAVSDIIVANVAQSGMYVLPVSQMQGTQDKQESMPLIFASIHTEGMPVSMMGNIVIGFIGQLIAAIFVGWLLTKTSGLSYFGRVWFVLIFALTAGIITEVPYWNWFAFDSMYTGVMIADLLIGWLFAGLILAKICVKK